MDPEKVEYELQHFNFCAEEMAAGNELLVKAIIQKSLVSFTDEFIVKHKIPAEEAMEMRANCYPIAGKMFADCGPKLEQLSQLYRKTFTIPDNILLPSDLMHRKEYTAEQVESLQATANDMEQQIRRDGVFLSMLQEEIKLHEQLEPIIKNGEELLVLAEQHRQKEVIPADDLAVQHELVELMKDIKM